MNWVKHLEKAKRVESSAEKLDVHDDWEAIVEILYGVAINYLAVICELKFSEHLNTHKGLPKFLSGKGLDHLATLFVSLDELRVGRWYGGKMNGESVEAAKEIIEEIKEFMEVVLNESGSTGND